MITGTVYDPQGAAVPGAAVTVTDNGTGAVYNTKTTIEGSFTVPGLSFGTYSVTVVASGFTKWETKSVQVITAQEAVVKVTLQVGAATETVTVEAAQVIVNTTSSELTTHVDRKQIVDLPSTTRNPLDFATQMAGVTGTGSATDANSVMNGLRGSSNNLTQDGIDIRDSFIKTSGFANNSGYDVNLESVGEFSISGQNLEADAGDGVAQVRMVTQRGFNALHGGLFYFGRNDAFNANTWFNNKNGVARSRLHQHRFGGSIGGPVYLPKLYHGKNRTFFFFDYSGFREHFQDTPSPTVYTADAKKGLYSYVGSNGALQTMNLLTMSSRGLGLNSLTQSLLNAEPVPVAGSAYSVVPSQGDGLNTLGVRFKVPGADPINQYDMRVDHKILESSRLGTHWWDAEWHSERSSYVPYDDPPFPTGVSPNCFGNVCNSAASETSKSGLFSTAINSTLSATTFNELRGGFSRPQIAFFPPQPFPRTFKVQMAGPEAAPEDNFDPQGRLSPFYQIMDNFTKLKGAHTFKAGFLISSASVHRYNDWSGPGATFGLIPGVTLGSTPTNDAGLNNCAGFPNLPSGSTGTNICSRAINQYVDLVGLVNNVSQSFNGVPGKGFVPGLSDEIFLRERSYNFYFTDSWKVRPNLTVNYGVRWEIVPAVDVVNKRSLVPANEAADLTPYGPLFTTGSATFNQLLAGLNSSTQLVAGGTSNGNPFWNTNYHSFAPSLGIAWQPFDRKTVVRAGYSISYVRDTLTIITNVGSTNGGLHTGAAVTAKAGDALSVLNASASYTLPSPPLNLPMPIYQNFLGAFSSTGASPGIEAFDPNMRTPYVQQWTFGLQRELSNSTALEIRYVGNHATGLYRGNDLDQPNLTPALLSEFQAAADNAATGAKNPTPVLTAIGFPSTLLSSSTFRTPLSQGAAGTFWYLVQSNCTQLFLTKAGCAGLGTFPANFFITNPLTGVARILSNSMHSSYDALQVEVRRSLSHGLQLQGNYVFGKVLSNSGITPSQSELDPDLDLRQPRYDRARASYDIRNTIHFNSVWEIPVGRGRRWASQGFIGKVLEGWQTGALWTTRSGFPITITSGRGTVSRNSGTNPAVAVGVSDRQVCSDIGVFKLGAGPYYLPQNDVLAGSTLGSTIGANPAMLANPPAGSLGDNPLRSACSGANFTNIDMNFIKKTKIREKATFEIRAEFFNIFNHPNFSVPSGNINNTGFGVLSSTVGGVRQIQFNGRLSF
ncbi:MAG: carboxypeptidase-like regulatory domain-containing protein [Bryobacteraceae bacterium]